MIYEYRPKGVCAVRFKIDIEDDKVQSIEALNGCNGNLKGISALVKGMPVDEVITRLEGIKCGLKDTSCPDQISKALREYKDNK